MNTQLKALGFALMFTPALVMANNFEADDLSLQIYNAEVTVESTENMEMINTKIKHEPTAAGEMVEVKKEKQLWDVTLPY